MKLLIVGGAGHVGSIIVRSLEKEFECTHFDLRPVPGFENKTIIADVCDNEMAKEAVAGMDAVIYLAMGSSNLYTTDPRLKGVDEINPAFDVNVRGLYRFLRYSLASGTKRFIYASSLSVYNRLGDERIIINEDLPADCWGTYGLSKRVGEFICSTASQAHPSACILVLRLILPRNEKDWPDNKYNPQNPYNTYGTGPSDTRRLFIKAVHLNKPGFHIIQASGDISNKHIPNHRALELLGWQPDNE